MVSELLIARREAAWQRLLQANLRCSILAVAAEQTPPDVLARARREYHEAGYEFFHVLRLQQQPATLDVRLNSGGGHAHSRS
jgi:hypothetical protein